MGNLLGENEKKDIEAINSIQYKILNEIKLHREINSDFLNYIREKDRIITKLKESEKKQKIEISNLKYVQVQLKKETAQLKEEKALLEKKTKNLEKSYNQLRSSKVVKLMYSYWGLRSKLKSKIRKES